MARTGPGPEGIGAQWHHFADFLRRALHAAADQVEPQADGLAPIRARIRARTGPTAGEPVSFRYRQRRRSARG